MPPAAHAPAAHALAVHASAEGSCWRLVAGERGLDLNHSFCFPWLPRYAGGRRIPKLPGPAPRSEAPQIDSTGRATLRRDGPYITHS